MSAFRIRSILVVLTPVCVFLLYCVSFRLFLDQSKYIADSFKHAISNENNGRVLLHKKEKFDKWIVVTSVFQPSEQVKFLATIPGWRLVVVGDRKTPLNWSLPGCDYLSLDTQKQLGFSLTDHLPFGSYARKNIGYLYAILNGAKYIYETDDDNRPDDNLDGFVLAPSMSGLMFVGNNVFNPYHHFGQSTLWPRGYPLSHIGRKQNRQYKVGSRWDSPTIQQGLVNGDPDMDAIFRLTRKPQSTILNVTFDPLAPPVILPEGVFSPFNSQNTLFHHAAFWALFISTTTTFRVCDIWRGYWAQRLMWEVGGRLAFFPANAFQKRNSHSYLEDAGQEKDMYFHTEELLLFLKNWSCEESFSFFQCVLKLTSDMSERNFWKSDDVNLVKLWLQDLKSIGYTEPTRVQFTLTMSNVDPGSPNKTEERSFFTQHAGENETVLNNVLYSPLEQPAPTFDLDSTNKNRFILKVDKVLSMCEDLKNISLTKAYLGETKNATFFSDILLIIVFNFPHYSNIKHLDAIHSLLFPYIVYCGDDQAKFQQESGDLGRTLTFIEVAVNRGYDGHMCAVKTMEMGYKVKGYLIAGDDVLFKPWSLLELNKSHAGVTFNRVGLLNISETSRTWHWWKTKYGRDAYLKSIEDLKQSNVPLNVKTFSEFQRTTLTHTKSSEFAPFGMSDFYYIPTALRSSAIWYFSKIYQHHLFLEMAVPFVLCGLETKDNIFELSGLSVWGEARNKIDSFYQKIKLYIHPAKLSKAEIVSEYCKDYFPELLEKLFGIE